MKPAAVAALRRAPDAAVKALMKAGYEPLAARVFAARGIKDPAHIAPALKTLPQPTLLPGLVALAERLAEVCISDEKICVVGDYDVDGVTATTIAYRCLRDMGAKVSWHIPNRSKQGYGLSPAIVDQQAAEGVQHILTVDNGVSAHAGIARAHELGLSVYITDHHQPGEVPVKPDHIVNPHVDNGGNSEFDNLVGVGLAFYLMAQVRRELGHELDMASYLDLVAMGTIADCGEMDLTNRALVGAGLARMRSGRTRPGITALAEICSVKPNEINSKTVGFRIAPRLNAAGRIANADVAMECLLAEDSAIAMQHAQQLNLLNNMRLEQQEKVLGAAMLLANAKRASIVVSDNDWHPGIIGIVAGKLADHYKRPAFVCYLENNSHWRGSGRSAGGVDLIAILSDIAERHPQVLLDFGGHRQAASIAVGRDALPTFTDLFNDACERMRSQLPPPTVAVDALSGADITPAALAQLEHVVWGNGFAPPLFAGDFAVLKQQPMRGGHTRMLVRDLESRIIFSAALFGESHFAAEELTALYSAELNHFNNKAQLVVEKVISPAQ